MRIIHLLIICSVFFGTQKVWSQEKLNLDSLFADFDQYESDSLKKAKISEYAFNKRFEEPELGIAILEKLKQSSFYKPSPTNPKYEDYLIGELHINANNFIEAERILKDYYNFWKEKEGHENDMGAAQLRLSDLYGIKGEREKAIKAALEAESLFKRTDKIDMQIRSATKIATLMIQSGRKDEALIKLKGLLNDVTDSKIALINIYNSLSLLYDEYGPVDSALVYMYKYKDLVFETPNLANRFIAVYNIALNEEKAGKLDVALKNIDSSFDLADKSGVPILKSYALLSKAGMLIKKGRLKEADLLFNEAEKQNLLSDQESLLLEGRFKLFNAMKKYEDALNFHEQWKALEDSLKSEEIAAKTNELQIQYETAKKENQIQRLETEQRIQAQKIKLQQSRILLLSIALLALGILFYVINEQRKRISKQNDIISDALKEKEILLKEIHHRVKNNLQIISSLLSLQSRSVKDQQASYALEEGQNRVQSMALIHQHLYSGENITGVKVKNYLQDLCRNVFQSHQIDSDQVSLNMDIEDIELDISTVVPLGLVLNELITNSCKYAFPNSSKGELSIVLKERDNVLIAEVNDDGIGSNENQQKGFGSKLIKSFARKMDASIITKRDNGTMVRLEIRNYKKSA